jgi:cytochrome c peroxidase
LPRPTCASSSGAGSIGWRRRSCSSFASAARACACCPDRPTLTDAGRGNITGLWTDLGRFKTPTLRALAARAPYFHNGIAATLEDVIRHYEVHLGFVFTPQQRADLAAFLKAL